MKAPFGTGAAFRLRDCHSFGALHRMLTGKEEPFCHFERRLYRALQEDGTSLWEARHPAAKLRQQKQLMGSMAFNREKMNEPAPEKGLFQEQWIHYYHPDSLRAKSWQWLGSLTHPWKAAGARTTKLW